MKFIDKKVQKYINKAIHKDEIIEKLNEVIAQTKINNIIHKKEEKKTNPVVVVLAVLGAVTGVALISYLVYKWLNPDYLEDFDDYEDEDYEEETETAEAIEE